MHRSKHQLFSTVSAALLAASLAAQSQQPSSETPKRTEAQTKAHASTSQSIPRTVEAFLRKLYAWGPAFALKIGTLKDAPVQGFYEVHIEVSRGDQTDTAIFYVSKDGRFLLRGDIQDMTSDPLAATRAQISLADSPSKGPQNARLVVVEYSDFECPTCRQLHQTLRALAPNYPQVRFVFKNFPLDQIHPWAKTAALAGRCAYTLDHDSFWKIHDLIYDNQQSITPENAYQKMQDFAQNAGLDPAVFKACIANPETTAAVERDLREGQALKIANTPTVFVNGRRMIGADRPFLEQYLQYELDSPGQQQTPASPATPARPPR